MPSADPSTSGILQGISLTGCNGLTVLAGTAATCAASAVDQCDIFDGGVVALAGMTGEFNIVDTTPTPGNPSVCLASASVEVFLTRDGTLMPANIGGMTFSPGTHVHPSAVLIPASTDVYLDAGGDPNAVFIFKMGTTLTTGAGVNIVLQNGAVPENVHWLLGSALTTGADNLLVGTILTGTAVTIGANTQICGDIIAQSAVTCSGVCNIGPGQVGCPISGVPVDPLPSVSPSVTPSIIP